MNDDHWHDHPFIRWVIGDNVDDPIILLMADALTPVIPSIKQRPKYEMIDGARRKGYDRAGARTNFENILMVTASCQLTSLPEKNFHQLIG